MSPPKSDVTNGRGGELWRLSKHKTTHWQLSRKRGAQGWPSRCNTRLDEQCGLDSWRAWGAQCFAKRCICFPQDMTTLSYLNEPGVLWNLKCRYVLDTIYTYTGSILIAVNPFQRLPHLYGPHMMEQYRGRALGELDPHVYAIADSAYRQMRTEGKSQSILVRTTLSFQHLR